MFFMALSLQRTVVVDTNYKLHLLDRQRAARSREGPAGATLPTLPRNCRLAGPVLLPCTLHLQVAPSTWLTPLHAGMK
jgi:hypothetical protein